MKKIYLTLGASCFALAFGSEVFAQTTATEDGAAQQNGIEEIIVTASRRSESIREVPTAVSAFSESKLREAQIASLSDLAALTPSVQINTYLTNANITVRGIGNGNFIQIGGDPGVAVHQNGVYLAQSALALMTFLDVQRVEVLRGPQGTLFGRNATGGAVNIISNAPTAQLSYGADLTFGVDPIMVRSSAYVSGPLDSEGKLLARVSVGQNYNKGYSKNLAATGPRRLDNNDDVAVRGQLQWLPDDVFSLRLIGEYQKNKDNGPAAYLSGVPVGRAGTPGPAAFPFVLLPLFGLPAVPDLVPPAGTIGDPKSRNAQANVGLRDMEAKTITAIGEWEIGGGSLKATASYNESTNIIAQDGDGTSIPFTQTAFVFKAKQDFGELIYTSDGNKPLSFILGANYFHEHLTQDEDIPTLNYPVRYLAGGVVNTESYAVFGHAQYKITPNTRIFGGMRYSHDAKQMSEYLNFGLLSTNVDRADWSKVTYEFGVSSDLSRTVTAYAKYGTGYKGGGYSVASFFPAFNPETNTNIEAGIKGAFLDGALQANLSIFHMNYNDLQVAQVQGLSTRVANAAKAKVKGVELETAIRPTDTLRFELSGAWLDSKFKEFCSVDSARPALADPTCTTNPGLDLSGNTLPNAPKWAGSFGVFSDFPTSAGTFTVGGRYDWKSRRYFSEFNTPISAQKAQGTLDLFLNYKSEDKRWTGSLFARNVTNELVKSNVVIVSALLGSLAVTQYQPSRQVGASIGYHF